MPDIEIFEADLGDTTQQQAVIELLDSYARDPLISGMPLSGKVRETLIDGLRTQPTTVVYLARCDQEYAGIAVCFQGFSTFAARPLMNIHDLAVLSAHRGNGVAKRLIAAVEQKAIQLNCCKVTLEVLERNKAARGLYDAIGFKPSDRDGAHHGERFLFLTKTLSE